MINMLEFGFNYNYLKLHPTQGMILYINTIFFEHIIFLKFKSRFRNEDVKFKGHSSLLIS